MTTAPPPAPSARKPIFWSCATAPTCGCWWRAGAGPVSAAELRQGYRATLRLARELSCPFWQVDLRGRNAPNPADRHWLTTEFLARAAQRLAGPVCLGYLLSPKLLAEMGGPTAQYQSSRFLRRRRAAHGLAHTVPALPRRPLRRVTLPRLSLRAQRSGARQSFLHVRIT
ncbi:MAG: hypothetical protein WKG07_15170 [Hymenobacter sp.]